MIAYFTHTLSFNLISNTVLILGIALPIIYFTTMIRSKEVTDTERSRVKAFIPLFILGMLFWSIQEQGSNVLNIYGIENSDMKLIYLVGKHILVKLFSKPLTHYLFYYLHRGYSFMAKARKETT